MQRPDFLHPAYLAVGNAKQQEVYAVLKQFEVFEKLSAFTPVLAGTFPIEIDIESSDLDIICCFEEEQTFTTQLIQAFSHLEGFEIRHKTMGGLASVVARVRMKHYDVEFFGQPIPVAQQNAYRHLLIEYRLLQAHGPAFKTKIIELKRAGYKTEPAFAVALGLDLTDPYAALLALEH
ncbi:MAG: DUF4269 domain-containing protein [Saprospiraceae bacterium]|nr:DUF4269 domain-containing protein [Saprospiraceae bacterium]